MKRSASYLLSELTATFEAREADLKQVYTCLYDLSTSVSGPYLFTWMHMQAQALLDEKLKHSEQENKLMTSVQVADNDVLEINVGGSLISTKRSTLTQVSILHVTLSANFKSRFQCLSLRIDANSAQGFSLYMCRPKGLPWLPGSAGAGNNVSTGTHKAASFWTLTHTVLRN